jgi:hypothetical protein
MTIDLRPEDLVEGDIVHVQRLNRSERRTVRSVLYDGHAGYHRVVFTDGTARYYDPNRLLEVEG